MRQALPNNLLHNPFYNRFHDPVTQRRDQMQIDAEQTSSASKTLEPKQVIQIADVFALVLVLVSVAVLLKAF